MLVKEGRLICSYSISNGTSRVFKFLISCYYEWMYIIFVVVQSSMKFNLLFGFGGWKLVS